MPNRARIRPILFLILLLLMAAPAQAQAQAQAQEQGQEQSPLDTLLPFSFDGIALGLSLDEAPGLAYSRTVHVKSEMEGDFDIDFYLRPGQSLYWDSIRLKSVEYGFCDGTLCSILAEAPGMPAFQAMAARWREKYGTDERTAFAYDTVWVRQYHDEAREYGSQQLWIVCEQQTDNCALAALRWYENERMAVLNIGQQLDY